MIEYDMRSMIKNEDIKTINKYFKKYPCSILPFKKIKEFDPSYEFIDFLIAYNSEHNGAIKINAERAFIQVLSNGNLDKILYFVEHLEDAMNTIKEIIKAYFVNMSELTTIEIKLYYRNLLIRTIEILKYSITLQEIADYLYGVLGSNFPSNQKFIILDATTYLIFQMIDDTKLKTTDQWVLIGIIEAASYTNSSKQFINILAEYLDSESKQKVDEYIASTVTPLTKPDYYESLFSESV